MILSNKAFIQADSTLRVKTVHIMQCIAFGQYGKSQRDRIIFLSHCQRDQLRQRIVDEGFEFIPIKRPHPNPGELYRSPLKSHTVLLL